MGSRSRFAGAMAAALVAAGLYTFASPPWDLWWCAWIVPALLLLPAARLSALGAASVGLVFGLGIAFGITRWAFHASLQYFSFDPWTAAGFVVLVWLAYSGIPYALLVSVYRFGARRCPIWFQPVVAAWAWASIEVLRSVPVLGMPWGLLSHTQWTRIGLIQIADVGGAYLVTFVVVFVSVSVGLVAAAGWSRPVPATRRWAPLVPAALVLALVLAYGNHSASSAGPPPSSARVAVVQGNVGDGFRWRRSFFERVLLRYVRLTAGIQAQAEPLDLVVWPENAVSFYLDREPMLVRPVGGLAKRLGASFLIGAPRLASPGVARNSAYLLDPDGEIVGAYDKRLLVPLAETPAFSSVAHAADEPVYTSGPRDPPLLVAGDLRLGTLICFEVLFPSLVREALARGADLLINVSNDSWMDAGDGAAPRQHFAMAVFRAVEMRRGLVRASSGGVSGFVDPGGRVGPTVPWGTSAAAAGKLPVVNQITPYARWGEAWISALTLVVLGVVARGSVRSRP